MTILIDEQTRQRVVTDRRAGDIDYKKKTTDTAIQKEDVKVIGEWKDYTGSDLGITSRSLFLNPRIPNQFQGQDQSLPPQNAKLPQLNEVGKNANINRRRVARVYKKIYDGH